MRTVQHSGGGHAPSFRGALVALATVGALLLAGCAPAHDLEPGAAPAASSPGRSASPGSATAAAGVDDAAQDRAQKDRAEKKAAQVEAAAKAAEQEAAEEKKAEKAAEKEAAEEAAAAKAAEKEAAEKKAAEERDRMLEYGDSGKRVTALQERLQELGYFLQDADGSFGPATQQAVWALQKAAGQYRDGVVGPKTQDALDRGVRPSAKTSSGKAIEIDIDRQLLMAVEDGKVTRIINASSGNGESYEAKGRTYRASTPRGSYAVYMERNGMHESTLELGSMYRPKYFVGGYAVHGSGSIPPHPASHGCVRVSNAAMNWLWDTWGLPKGTPVILY
ncbi:L,D-transpeptidase family protein [Isoptericola sp. NEAU-Y5]|uniref:L,D-transpeptidase family protein n=1 Tax=Isoptericola luteus TaxID=2879484 RepID=A0ABS7ZEI8_9MICO|nr:L,D-transpeptidase family protein [Isoptericola sp. NEAU-Y5]MCA5892701.1 L,D-transpeptidase family protein [Isoptericola sp. NEAU-Y5]